MFGRSFGAEMFFLTNQGRRARCARACPWLPYSRAFGATCYARLRRYVLCAPPALRVMRASGATCYARLRRYVLCAPPALRVMRASGATCYARLRRYVLCAPPALRVMRASGATCYARLRRDERALQLTNRRRETHEPKEQAPYETNFDLSGFLVVGVVTTDVALRYQQRDGHDIDRDRAAVLTRLCAVALVVATAPRRLQAGARVSTRLRHCPQPSRLPDRNSRRRQNFGAVGSVSMQRRISADGHCLRTRIRLELSRLGAIKNTMALPATVQEELIRPQTIDDPPVIDLHGLSVAFGRRQILKNLRGDLRGKAIGLLGPNGAGKTTLIHTLLGFHQPNGGTAHIFGHDIIDDAKKIRALIGYMPERDSFIAKMTAVHFVRLMAELSGLPSDAALERAHEALFYVGLGEARYRKLETYSLGMKQLAKLAQAIVHGPKLIFLDEPTNGLDPPARLRMIKLIREIRASGQAQIVLSSHLLVDVEECCDEILILRDGQIAVYCNLEEERKSNRKFLMLETRGDQKQFVAAMAKLGCEYAVSSDSRLKVVLQDGIEVRDLYRLASETNVQLRRLSYKRDSLEDIFLKAMENGYGGL